MESSRACLNRRQFLGGLTAAGTVGIVGTSRGTASAAPPPETTTLTMVRIPGICPAPQYLVEELLKADGWSDVRYVQADSSVDIGKRLLTGDADITMHFAGSLVAHVDAGDPIVVLAGIHSGCMELFGTGDVRTVRDLKGKTIAVPASAPHRASTCSCPRPPSASLPTASTGASSPRSGRR